MTADLFSLEQSAPQALRIMLVGCWLATDCRVVLALRRHRDSWALIQLEQFNSPDGQRTTT